MIFLWSGAASFEEEEEEEAEGGLNDALLDELDDEDLADEDELLEGDEPIVPEGNLDTDEGVDETAKAFFDDEDGEEEDDAEGDYDSFDDKDEL